ncbi:TetR/AcrR family transcriptional regulator [Kineococcus sp. TBRC 1896]|uniref:TetR/AcrR family transcriptional regulator n=1 Tax=Kineococcus mangrovi TaxID=1660183 RepID=A0ABV4I3Z8_9ACTN
MSARAGTGRVGRPRSRGGADDGRTPRQEILDAAAALFSESGFAATSTRAIADRVGIRQASLYHHFAGKDEILLELLEASVRPTLDVTGALRSQAPDAASALHALVVVDVGTLLAGPLGTTALYVAPEVQQPRFEQFREHRRQLGEVYAELARDVVPAGFPVDAHVLGQVCLHLVEMAATLPGVDQRPQQIAAACLGACGVTGDRLAAAARGSEDVRAGLSAPAGAGHR